MANQDHLGFGDLMSLRAAIYRMLGSVFFTELTTEQIQAFSAQDFSIFADMDPEMADGAKEVERALRHVNSSTREELAVDYAYTFLAAGAGRGDTRAVPYESVFTSDRGLLMGPARQSVYRTMLKEGVLPDQSLNTPEDHFSFECEFMASLAENAASACAAGDLAEAQRLVEVQAQFRQEHLANWVNSLYGAVLACCRTRFYGGMMKMAKAFIRLDYELLAEANELAAA